MVAYAFDTLNASALYAGHHPDNAASRALLTRLGFTQIGTHFFARTGLQHAWCRKTSRDARLGGAFHRRRG